MKQLVIILITLITIWIGITVIKPTEDKPDINSVTWVETREWSITDNATKKIYCIEFGFDKQGIIFWRRGRETKP